MKAQKKKSKTKKTAKKKSAPKAKAKKKAVKAKGKAPAKAKTKAAAKSKVKAKTKSPAKKKSAGLTVQDLFRLKQEKEQAAQNALNPDWQHKKDLPPQGQHSPEAPKDIASRKSGLGGIRHH